jgi:hypothetical protein
MAFGWTLGQTGPRVHLLLPRSFRAAPRHKCGFETPRDHKHAERIDGKNTNTKWLDATKLEMAQLHECDTFKDHGCKGKPPPGCKANCFSKHHPAARHRDLQSVHPHELPSQNSNCFDCLRDDNDDNDSDTVTATNNSASDALHAQPKASHSSAAPTGEGVLIPLHAGHASHAACACALSRTLEQTCKAAALLRHFSAAHPL